jgi:hypothetical protein
MSQASFASANETECCASLGNQPRAKLQNPQRALQALVIAKWHTPGPPSHTALRAIFQIEGLFEFLLPNVALRTRFFCEVL